MKKMIVMCFCFIFGWQCHAQETDPLSMPLLIPYLKGNLYGFSDLEGNIIIQPNYESVKFFNRHNLALVKKDDLYGFINRKGELVVPCFSNKSLSLNKMPKFYDQYGIKDTLKHLRIVEDRGTHKWILFNLNTLSASKIYEKYVVRNPCSDFEVNSKHYRNYFYNGIRKVKKKNNLINFINIHGQEILDKDYYNAKALLGDYYCIVAKGLKCALFNSTHGRITDFSYGNIESIVGTDHFIVTQNIPNTGMGIINPQGKLVSTIDYEEMKSAFNGHIIAAKQGEYGLLNTKGEVIT